VYGVNVANFKIYSPPLTISRLFIDDIYYCRGEKLEVAEPIMNSLLHIKTLFGRHYD